MLRWSFGAALGLLLLLAASGCGGDEQEAPGGEPSDSTGAGGHGGGAGIGGGGAGGVGETPLEWTPCPVRTGGTGDAADCATVSVPARWDEAEGPAIDLFVKRIGAPDAQTQVWMLNGGPGASGADFEPLAEYLVSVDATLSFYLLDHRGTGRSTRLGCPEGEAAESPGGLAIEEAEWPACLEHVTATFAEVLDGFTTTNAAHDVGRLIERTRGPDQRVVVWGGSYGTRWLQRYIHFYPDQADGLSMTGIAHPDLTFAEYDARYDAVGSLYLDRCSADAFCSSKLGPDADTRAHQVLDMLDGGHCPAVTAAGMTRAVLQPLFAYWLLYAWEERALVPAILYRIERCAPGDVQSLSWLGAALQQPVPPGIDDELHSTVLGTHVGLSELWPEQSPPLSDLQAVVDAAVYSLGVGVRFRLRRDTWPVYPRDDLVGELGATSRPMLMLEGDLDPATPAASAAEVGAFYSGPGQLYIGVPGAGHSFVSPTRSGSQCMLSMFFEFARHPDTPAGDCSGDVLELDFHGTPEMAATYLAADDLWEDATSDSAAASRDPAPLREYWRWRRRLGF